MTTVFKGTFNLTRPLHCSAGSDNKDGGKNIIRTMKQPVFTQKGMDMVPYYPGNGLRGRLRDIAAYIAIDHITAHGQIERALYSGMTSGSEGGQPDTAPLTVEELLRSRTNPFMGLFGGGARMLRSTYTVEDLVPVISSTIAAGMVPAEYGDASDVTFTPQAFPGAEHPVRGKDLIHVYHTVRIDDVLRMTNPDALMRSVRNPVEEVDAYQQKVADNQKDRKHDKMADEGEKTGAKKIDAANMISYEAIAAGVPMFFRLTMSDSLSNAQIGLMALAVCDLVNKQNLGGIIRCGLGRYAANLTMTREGNVTPLLRLDGEQYVVTGEAEGYLDAMREQLATLTGNDMLQFYLPRVSAEDAEAKLAIKTAKAGKGAAATTAKAS